MVGKSTLNNSWQKNQDQYPNRNSRGRKRGTAVLEILERGSPESDADATSCVGVALDGDVLLI